MPRFHVVLADTSDGNIHGYIARIDSAVDAILNHPWFTSVYRSEWVAKNLDGPDEDTVKQNIWSQFSWSVLCVNLDEAIMNALNGGDSNACSSTGQS